jgi:hypothetical protein
MRDLSRASRFINCKNYENNGSVLHGSNTLLGLLPQALIAHALTPSGITHGNSADLLAFDATFRHRPTAAHRHIFVL